MNPVAPQISLLAQAARVDAEHRLELAARPHGWAVVALLALAVAVCWYVLWMYGREGRTGASRRARLVMAGLRCLVLLGLIVVSLEPVLATYLHRWVDSYTLVLIDASASMDLQDRYRGAEQVDHVARVAAEAGSAPLRRLDLVERILTVDGQRLLQDLAVNNRVRVGTFADDYRTEYTLRRVGEGSTASVAAASGADWLDAGRDAPTPLPTEFAARGSATDLGLALRQAVETLGRAPLAGVVLLTDGGLNAGDSAEAIAAWLRERKIPLHVIGIGDPLPPRNARVAGLVAPESVFAADPFALVAQVQAEGLQAENLAVELWEEQADAGQEPRLVTSQTLTPSGPSVTEPITFQHRQPAVGRYVYRVQVSAAQLESTTEDNARQATLNVVANRLRVLLIAGAPSWEYRYLARLLQRDGTFELSCWLQSADDSAARDGNVIIDHLPAAAEELFAYDAVVMIDPDPGEFTPQWSELCARLVSQQGGGWLYAAARLHTPAFMRDPAVAELVKILPVAPDPDADLLLNEIGHYQLRGRGLLVPPAAAGHPVLRLPAGPGGVPLSWSTLGEVYWHYPVLREKPVATVLLRHADPRMQSSYGPHVLLATQYVGAGRSAWLGFDGTWRWRAIDEEIFNRFWVQLIRHLVEGRLGGGNRRGLLLTESDSCQLGETLRISARLLDAAFNPWTAERLEVAYRLEDAQGTVVLQPLTERPGWYQGGFAPPRTGACELALTVPGGEPPDDVVRREVQVLLPNREILRPQMARAVLRGLADQSPGGHYYEVDEAPRIPAAIPDRHESSTMRTSPRPVWDRSWVLAAFVAVLGLEWTLRKLGHLL